MNKLLLQLSTSTRGEENLRPVNLGKLVKRVVDAKANEPGDIGLEASGNVVALGYEQRFERVIGHLVQNAIDATSDRGVVTVYVFAEDETAFDARTDVCRGPGADRRGRRPGGNDGTRRALPDDAREHRTADYR